MRRTLFVAATALLLLGCSRSLPDPPPESPLASEAGSAPSLPVDLALRSDPPLPGQPREGWPGLVDPAPSEHHHHHHAKPEAKAESESAAPTKGGAHAHH
ncbi:hypothetical protein ACNOYE_36960 [Nannocystaceae bacterium ST9]